MRTSRLLLEKGHRVFGLLRQSASSDVISERLRWIGVPKQAELIDANTTGLSALLRAVQAIKPDEVYNLAAQSFVAAGANGPILDADLSLVAGVSFMAWAPLSVSVLPIACK